MAIRNSRRKASAGSLDRAAWPANMPRKAQAIATGTALPGEKGDAAAGAWQVIAVRDGCFDEGTIG